MQIENSTRKGYRGSHVHLTHRIQYQSVFILIHDDLDVNINEEKKCAHNTDLGLETSIDIPKCNKNFGVKVISLNLLDSMMIMY